MKIAFEVPRTADEYMFYIESSLDPLQTYWKIGNHKQTKSEISKSNEKFDIDTNEYYKRKTIDLMNRWSFSKMPH